MKHLKDIADELVATPLQQAQRVFELARALGEGVQSLRVEDFAPAVQKDFATTIVQKAKQLAGLSLLGSDEYKGVITDARKISDILKHYLPQQSSTEPSRVYHIHDSTGVFGDVSNSNVQIYDFSSIHQLLKQQHVPQSQRNEIENLMDELNTASPEKKRGLIEKGKAWLVKNEKFLGATASIVRKALGSVDDAT